MNCWSTAVGNFRSERKCFSISGSLLLMLLLFAAQAACQSTDELHEGFEVGDEYPDADNIEWHHVKIVDGVMREDHPVVMYKEDFVSEDYDPKKNRSHSAESRPHRKYKEISERRRKLNRTDTEQYRALKPEKIYFDVLSQAPLVVSDDSAANDSKFDASKIRVEVIPLTDDEHENKVADSDESLKELLNKRPKKYHRRMRRSALEQNEQVQRSKRNPYYRTQSENNNLLRQFYEGIFQRQLPSEPRKQPAVQGKFWNSINSPIFVQEVTQNTKTPQEPQRSENRFGAPDNTDVVIWPSSSKQTQRKPAVVQPATSSKARPPASTQLFHDSNPENANLDFLTRAPPVRPSKDTGKSPVTSAPAKESVEEQVSLCVWAVVNCCSSRDINIRYHCFEELNCTGAFWDLNPCADGVRDNLVNYVGEIYN